MGPLRRATELGDCKKTILKMDLKPTNFASCSTVRFGLGKEKLFLFTEVKILDYVYFNDSWHSNPECLDL